MEERLPDEKVVAEYPTVVQEENDPAALADALNRITRAHGMGEIAKAFGITREALYKMLGPDASPRFETISKVCAVLGVRLAVELIYHPMAFPDGTKVAGQESDT